MNNNLFKLIKNNQAIYIENDRNAAIHALVRCSTEEARGYLPLNIAQQLNVLPLAVITMQTRRLLTIASSIINDDIKKSLRFSCGIDVKLIPMNAETLKKALFLAYNSSDILLTKNIKALGQLSQGSIQSNVNGLSNIKCEVNDFLKALITYAIVKKASDIHFLPSSSGLFIKLRVDGELRAHENPVCSPLIYKRIVSRIKSLSNMDVTQNEVCHDGSLSYGLDGMEICIRVSIMPTIHGEKIVLRLHGAQELLKLENLGFDEKTINFMERVIEAGKGLILCTGNTGSGKSTSLYAILDRLNNFNRSIITVEDPVEIKLPFASQTALNPKKGIGYSEALKTALRQDPDCIMLGELRDSVSAKIAFQAALTGHLVITSMHAGSVIESIQRLYEMGIDSLTISQTTSLVINQKLLPKICGACKVVDSNSAHGNNHKNYKVIGCAACDYYGYQGRVVACESLMPDDVIKECLLEPKKLSIIKRKFNDHNYQSMDASIQKLLELGHVQP